MKLVALGDDVFLVRAARFTLAEAIHDDGTHANIVLATLSGNYNAPDTDPADVALTEVTVMLEVTSAARFAEGLNELLVLAAAGPEQAC
ncbi:MAG TPA: hypothetical protein VJM75_03245 [Acidimicrobiales bacterium]|nr:hypothetical protein [Acidimicrobiales bacterium]